MHKIRVILADSDNDYVDKVSDFINWRYSTRIRITVFTKANLLENYLRSSSEKTDILLINPKFLSGDQSLYQNAGIVVQLSDGSLLEGNDEELMLFKYQPGEKLVNQLLNMYSGKNSAVIKLFTGSNKTRVVSVYSPAGGVGKTSITLGLAACLGELGCNVFCLSLESVNSMAPALAHTGNNGMTHILLSLAENQQVLPIRTELYKTRDPLYKFDYFEPPDCFLEMAELKVGAVNSLIKQLKNSNYDVILIDLESSADDTTLGIIENSDKVILVETPDNICRFKTDTFLSQIRRMEQPDNKSYLEKLIRVVNKTSEHQICDREVFNLKSGVCIPIIQNLWNGDSGSFIFDANRTLINSLALLAREVSGVS